MYLGTSCLTLKRASTEKPFAFGGDLQFDCTLRVEGPDLTHCNAQGTMGPS